MKSSRSPTKATSSRLRGHDNISHKTSRSSQTHFPNSPPPTPPPQEAVRDTATPFYISRVHRPSTNPEFILNIEETPIPEWVDTSSQTLNIALWARAAASWISKNSVKGKDAAIDDSSSWDCLCKWDLDLTHAEPLPEEVRYFNVVSQVLISSCF